MPKLSKSNTATQRDSAYNELRRLLILQQIEPGNRLREPEWAARLCVHRSALREALARLEAEGLVERGQRTGFFVPALSAQDLRDISKVRLALECLAIEEICANPDRSLTAAEAACRDFAHFLDSGYSLGLIEADRRFHESLVDAAGLRRLSLLYHRAPLPMIHGRIESEQRWRAECGRTLEEHRQILNALARRNAATATNILRRHLQHRSIPPICR